MSQRILSVRGAVLGERRQGGPDESGELAGHGDDGLLGQDAAVAHLLVAAMEPVDGSIGEGDRPGRLSLTAVSESSSDVGPVSVVPGGLDEESSDVAVAGLGDGALSACLTRAVLAGDEADVSLAIRHSIGVSFPGRRTATLIQRLCTSSPTKVVACHRRLLSYAALALRPPTRGLRRPHAVGVACNNSDSTIGAGTCSLPCESVPPYSVHACLLPEGRAIRSYLRC